MWSRQKRLVILGVIMAGVASGFVLKAAMDPLEEHNLAWMGLLASLLLFGVVGGWISRRFRTVGTVNERQAAIERRSWRFGYGVLLVGVSATAVVLLLPSYSGPVWPLLIGLVVVSVGVHELSVGYYRRTM